MQYIDPTGESFWSSVNTWTARTNAVVNTVGGILTLGGWNLAIGMADQAGDRLAREGITVGSVANVAGSVITGTVAAGAGAAITGAEAGSLAIGAGLVSVTNAVNNRIDDIPTIRANLGNASGRTINGSVRIPPDWRVQPTRGAGGTLYSNPTELQENIRLMPGNPSSPHEVTRIPYWRHQVNGGYLDSNNQINANRSETHFPINSIE